MSRYSAPATASGLRCSPQISRARMPVPVLGLFGPYFFYEVYYGAQAMFQMGDAYFLAYYPRLVAILLDHQDKDGSWLSGDGNDRSGGRNYCTAMAVLALAVEYRYLPIYQR